VRIAGLEAKHVAAGARHTCDITTAGEVRCWGAKDAGQIADELALTTLHGATAIAAGGDGTCAVLADRTVRCWGKIPGRGVIGVTPIEGLADVTGVALGESHVCAVKAWGGVACWGKNGEGELGDGSFTDRIQPIDVMGLSASARAVAVGRTHTCALLAEGTIRCWGGNTNSQLADGTHGHRASPALVQGLFEVQGLDVAGDATCARFTDGSARCWGGLQLPKTEGAHVPVPTEVRW
jgi:alpha-tubulin suppressor-like RCC1 family protein